MRVQALSVFPLLLSVLSCAADPDTGKGGESSIDALSVAALNPSTPLAEALAEVDPRPFVPLGSMTDPVWTGRSELVSRLQQRGVTRYVEPMRWYWPSWVPNDPNIRRQWALADMRADVGWDRARSAAGVVVAVIDTGVQLSHPDLKGALWVNPREKAGNRRDDDGNGLVDDVNGWDFVDNDADPSPVGRDDAAAHGTHVAGIIGAVANNRVGISGVAPGVRLMALRVAGPRGASSSVTAAAVDYAVKNGAAVINLSLGGGYSRLLDEALARAWSKGVLVVAAAGNDGAGRAGFPASSTVSGVVGVAATDPDKYIADYSNVGPGVDMSAPGTDILSTVSGSGYRLMSGTSMAAPQVSGAVALRLAARGGKSHGTVSSLLSALPKGPEGMRRLDLPSLLPASRMKSQALVAVGEGSFEGVPADDIAVDLDVEPSVGEWSSLPPEGLSLVQGHVVQAVSDEVTVAAGALLALRPGQGEASWSVDGEQYEGTTLVGLFPRPGRYRVRAVDTEGQAQELAVIVAAGGAGAEAGVGVSNGG